MKKHDKKGGVSPFELGVYIYGQRSVLIDGRAGIRDYTSEYVVFDTPKKNVYLKISGASLTVRTAGESVSEIRGFIREVCYERGEKSDKSR